MVSVSSRHSPAVVVVSIGLLLAVAATAHRDTLFPIGPTGELSRVPEEFAPVILRIRGVPEAPKVSLAFRSRVVDLPPCIGKLFFPPAGESVFAKGSWYHDRSLLPPYVSFDLPRKTIGPFYSGHSVLFDLETGELLQLQEHTASPDGTSMVSSPLPIAGPCDPQDPLTLKPAGRPSSRTTEVK